MRHLARVFKGRQGSHVLLVPWMHIGLICASGQQFPFLFLFVSLRLLFLFSSSCSCFCLFQPLSLTTAPGFAWGQCFFCRKSLSAEAQGYMVARINAPPPRCPHLNLHTWDWVGFPGRSSFAGVMRLRICRWELSWLSPKAWEGLPTLQAGRLREGSSPAGTLILAQRDLCQTSPPRN